MVNIKQDLMLPGIRNSSKDKLSPKIQKKTSMNTLNIGQKVSSYNLLRKAIVNDPG